MNQNETGTDCGGECEPCATFFLCYTGSDCQSGICSDQHPAGGGSRRCTFPTCSDGIKNGGETDIDCGISACGVACDDGRTCASDQDCSSGRCRRSTRNCIAPLKWDRAGLDVRATSGVFGTIEYESSVGSATLDGNAFLDALGYMIDVPPASITVDSVSDSWKPRFYGDPFAGDPSGPPTPYVDRVSALSTSVVVGISIYLEPYEAELIIQRIENLEHLVRTSPETPQYGAEFLTIPSEAAAALANPAWPDARNLTGALLHFGIGGAGAVVGASAGIMVGDGFEGASMFRRPDRVEFDVQPNRTAEAFAHGGMKLPQQPIAHCRDRHNRVVERWEHPASLVARLNPDRFPVPETRDPTAVQLFGDLQHALMTASRGVATWKDLRVSLPAQNVSVQLVFEGDDYDDDVRLVESDLFFVLSQPPAWRVNQPRIPFSPYIVVLLTLVAVAALALLYKYWYRCARWCRNPPAKVRDFAPEPIFKPTRRDLDKKACKGEVDIPEGDGVVKVITVEERLDDVGDAENPAMASKRITI